MSKLSPAAVDPRGPRFAAWITSVVLAIVVLTGSGWLLAAQAVVFALGAFVGLGAAPYAALYRALIAPRLAPPTEREDATPVRFAQGVGFVFALVGTVGYLAGAPLVGIVATSAALIAAFLNAAFGLCLGCLAYLRGRLLLSRFSRTKTPHKGVPA
ncbi:DUF4395 domain-containing protein [Cryptosporangium arvum]|uniref:DUF4395 domain-containing protein n=1 Tax=Cryptosporangium arvum TaxID=80871 RepID=UPI0004B51C54|nr:DUF4395 domain-containing protein [Cryptosporangium arvum]